MNNWRVFWRRTKPFWATVGAILTTWGTITTITGLTIPEIFKTIFPKKKEGCVILDYRGKNAVFARVSVINLGLVPVIQNEKNDQYKIGTIIAQEPMPGAILSECSGQVVLQVSADDRTVAETPVEEYQIAKTNTKNGNQIDLGRVLFISMMVLAIFYLIYKAIDFDLF